MAMTPPSTPQKGVQPLVAEESAKKKLKTRFQNRRAVEEQVERCMKAHFSHLTHIYLESCRVDGKPLRQKILDDMIEKDNGGRLGARYWADLKQQVGDGEDSVDSIVVDDPSQTVSDDLQIALERAVDTNNSKRTLEPLVSFLSSTGGLNQKELIRLRAFCV